LPMPVAGSRESQPPNSTVQEDAELSPGCTGCSGSGP
jgi:hypothetical protein